MKKPSKKKLPMPPWNDERRQAVVNAFNKGEIPPSEFPYFIASPFEVVQVFVACPHCDKQSIVDGFQRLDPDPMLADADDDD